MSKKTFKKWQPCDEKILLSYHKKGLDYIEVAKLMNEDPKRVKNKASSMGIILKANI